MSKIRVVPFKAEHINLMDIRDYELQTTFVATNAPAVMQVFEQSKMAGTIICDGRIIAAMGAHELWPGVCELWVIPSVYLHEYALPFARTIRRAIESGILSNYTRIQILAVNDELHNRWVKFLKFDLEGTMRKYDNLGNDMNIWSRVK